MIDFKKGFKLINYYLAEETLDTAVIQGEKADFDFFKVYRRLHYKLMVILVKGDGTGGHGMGCDNKNYPTARV